MDEKLGSGWNMLLDSERKRFVAMDLVFRVQSVDKKQLFSLHKMMIV